MVDLTRALRDARTQAELDVADWITTYRDYLNASHADTIASYTLDCGKSATSIHTLTPRGVTLRATVELPDAVTPPMTTAADVTDDTALAATDITTETTSGTGPPTRARDSDVLAEIAGPGTPAHAVATGWALFTHPQFQAGEGWQHHDINICTRCVHAIGTATTCPVCNDSEPVRAGPGLPKTIHLTETQTFTQPAATPQTLATALNQHLPGASFPPVTAVQSQEADPDTNTPTPDPTPDTEQESASTPP